MKIIAKKSEIPALLFFMAAVGLTALTVSLFLSVGFGFYLLPIFFTALALFFAVAAEYMRPTVLVGLADDALVMFGRRTVFVPLSDITYVHASPTFGTLTVGTAHGVFRMFGVGNLAEVCAALLTLRAGSGTGVSSPDIAA